MNDDIIEKLKESGLRGRSGSGFPTGLKWEMVKKAKGEKTYIVCNGAEGEPDVLKDGFILENYPQEIIDGIKIALKTFDNSSAYLYLRKDYYQKLNKKLKKIIAKSPITLFKKPSGYLNGEETVICEVIEGKKSEPRLKPPYPTEKGIWGYPTLINNVETFYCISKIAKDEYQKERFYSINGSVKNKGVYKLPKDWIIEKILKETGNYPNFKFFIQMGGGASGEILSPQELNRKIEGIGSIIVFNRQKTNPFSLMKKWAHFFYEANCDKCIPCREGIYRINEMLKTKKIDNKLMADLIFVLEETSFCGLGKAAAVPFKSLIQKLYD